VVERFPRAAEAATHLVAVVPQGQRSAPRIV